MSGTHAVPTPAKLNVRRLLLLFVPLVLLIVGLMTLHYWFYTSAERSKLEESQTLGVELSHKVIADNLDLVVSEVRFLGNHIQQRVTWEYLSTAERQEIQLFLRTFNRYQTWFDQIRYFDLMGNEVVRINQNQGRAEAVPKEELQNKSDRYYFAKLQQLERGQVYISPLDLNVEGDQVELPVKPMIRVGVAIHSLEGRKVGYLLVNYYGQQLINDFNQVSGHIPGQMLLVNPNGYWLISPDEGLNWGFMLDHNKRFLDRYPSEWVGMLINQKGQFESANGLFTYDTVYPYRTSVQDNEMALNLEAESYFWKVISFAPNASLNEPRRQFFRRNGFVYLFSLFLAFVSAGFITQARQRHEDQLLQTTYERSFRHVLENIQLAAVTLDPWGRISFCNDYFVTLSGYSRAELLGWDWVNLLAEGQYRSGDYTLFLDQLRQHQLPEHSEHSLRTKNDQLRLLDWTNTYIFDSDGEVSSVTLIGRDITEQRDIEDQLVKLSMAVEQSPNTVMITDPQGLIEYVNPMFTQLTGYQPGEVIGHRPSVLQSGETRPDEYRDLWHTISAGETWQGMFKNRKKNGEFYWEKTVISPIFDTNDEIRHYLSVKEDVTKQLLLEQEIEQQREESRKNRELAAVGQMANMVAHDLRNPLSSIKMGLQILSKDKMLPMDASVRELMSISQEQVRYMEGILTDLMSYSRPTNPEQQWLTLERLMETTVISLQKQIQQQRVEVVEYYQKGVPMLYGDPVQLRQVFTNLLLNAIQAVDGIEQPRIELNLSLLMTDTEPKVQITVSDNGPGIDPCLTTKVFEPFYTSKAKGTGLGLAIVRQRVELHGGSIRLTNAREGGTRATVTLPVSPAN